ncbi:PREDICTED: dehydrogenase/reductase SDR family member on chromosome X-like [Priapulus caudatus]|uniref:Dehydrogenase/reductase SDR family member on chromosome X-like n=1 Tax=Priapulus caudatus TaxID=37621 RepID=A0ABM1ESW7_PRICU|nr:PREDICTED: dehydrogenase/reductase SDR family member on chromosome X-like [Priapulus caudatus]
MIDSIIVVRQSLSYFWHAVVSFVLVYWIGVVSLLKQLWSKTNNEIKGSLPLIIPGVKHEVVAIVTGGCSGIGFCVARHLAGAGVHVIIASKNKDHGSLAVDVVTNERPEAKVEYMEMDLESNQSVRRFVARFLEKKLPLQILINDAGVMFPPCEMTMATANDAQQAGPVVEYMEMDLESNQSVRRFVARFLEKKLPLQILINDAGVMFPPCEMTMATANDAQFAINYLGHFLLSLLLLDHMKLTAGPTNWGRIINLASSVHLVGTMDIDALLCRYLTMVSSADEAARNILMLALSPDLDGVSGHYYDVTQRARPNAMCEDACLRERLWEESCRLVNVAS